MKKFLYLVAAAALTFSSCNKDDKNDDGVTPANEPNGKGDVKEALDNQKAKEQLQNYATEFLNSFKPEEQKTAIEALNAFANLCEDAEFPESWSKDKEVAKKNFVGVYAKNLAKSLETKNYSKSTTVNEEFVYDFKDYAGVYEIKNGEWTKTSESSDIVFKYKCSGKNCEFKAVQDSKNVVSETFNDGEEEYKISFPAGLTINLTQDGTELLKTVIDVNYKSQESMKTTASVTVANLVVTSETTITNKEISDAQTVAINGNTLLYYTLSATGNHFCDVDHFETVAQNEDAEVTIQDYVENTSVRINIMGNVQIKSDAKIKDLTDDVLSSREEAQKQCDVWNKSFVTKFYFSGTDVEQGLIKYQPKMEYQWRDEEDWSMQPVIYFNADGTSYAFEDYFDDSFANTEDQCEALWDKYEAYWK